MVAEKITSVQHRLIKHAYQLKRDKSYREEVKKLLLIGKSALQEVTRLRKAEILFISEEDPLSLPAKETYLVSDAIREKITGATVPTPFAIFDFPEPQDLTQKPHLLVLDQIQDPGNVGTLFRSAYALGFEGVYLLPHTADPFNDKALSASKGASLLLPFIYISELELVKRVKEEHRTPFLADIEGTSCSLLTYKPPLFLILSHETRGARDWSFNSVKITIPMKTGIDSLNVASAGAILLYQMKDKAEYTP